MTAKPWHDSAPCPTCPGGGAVIPGDVRESDGLQRPIDAKDVREVSCATCGNSWTEWDLNRLAQIWWAAGAYVGAEEARKGVTP